MLARELLEAVGPGRILLIGAEDDTLAAELRRQGCDAHVATAGFARFGSSGAARIAGDPPEGSLFDTIVLHGSALGVLDEPIRAFSGLRECCVRFIVLAPGQDRALPPGRENLAYWRFAALRAGFRRSLHSVDPERDGVGRTRMPALMVFERVGNKALAHPAMASDATRDASPRADARLMRYVLASRWVRPNDVVLDWNCGAGDGAAMIAVRTTAARVVASDRDGDSIAYARAHFAGWKGIDFHVAEGAGPEFLPDASVDLVIAFDGIMPGAPLDALLRVLKPDGRLVASLQRVDPGAANSGRRHANIHGWADLRNALATRLRLEARFLHELPADEAIGPVQPPSRVGLDEPDLGQNWIAVACCDPLAPPATGVPYRHPQFDEARTDGSVVADFGRHYRNPWLYRPMVQMGERLTDKELLNDLAARVVECGETDTPDFGAALTVMTYSMIEERRFALVPDLLMIARTYVAQDNANPHVLRWRISLAYACALTCLATGDRAAAAGWLETVTSLDPLGFSPLLATKTIAAWFWLGVMRLVDDDTEAARQAFVAGVEAARRALHASDTNAIGDPERPLPFGFQELAEVADMASQCASALNNLALYARSPPLFWSKIDTRRFGLATWLLHLERENAALRAAQAGA